jgi:ATP-dependent Clp protease protease subunit
MKTIFFFDDFNDTTAEFLIKDLAIAAKSDKDIRLIINSPGGSVTSLLSIIDSINLIDMNLETVCIGQAASAGSVLFSCGKKRYITKNARLLLHQVSGGAWGNIQDMEIEAAEAKRLNEVYLDILSKNIGKDKETLRKDMQRDFILTAEQAVAYGLADSVISENIFSEEIMLFKKSQFEDAVINTIKEMASDKEIKLCEIKDKELFKAGTYKGRTFTQKDIEELVKNTNYLIENFGFVVPIKLGHDNNKEVGKVLLDMLKSDSMPAFGQAKNLRAIGDSLIGDLTGIPQPLYNLIDKQFFCKKSPEIWNSYSIKGKTLGLVLDSIALLGATQPEIPDLFSKEYIEKGEQTMPGTNTLTEEQIKANLLKEQEAEAKKQAEEKARKEELAKKDKAVTDAQEEAAKAKRELEEYKAAVKKEKIEAKVNALVDKGVIFPYQKNALAAVFGKIEGEEEKIKFSKTDGKEEEISVSAAFEELLTNRPKIDFTKQYSQHTESDNADYTDAEKEAMAIHRAAGKTEEEIKTMFAKK